MTETERLATCGPVEVRAGIAGESRSIGGYALLFNSIRKTLADTSSASPPVSRTSPALTAGPAWSADTTTTTLPAGGDAKRHVAVVHRQRRARLPGGPARVPQ